MNVALRLFAAPKQIAGCDVARLELPSQATVADLRIALVREFPRLSPMSQQLRFAVNAEYANDETRLSEQDELACIPPVSGG
jgi:molybdopterin converting factor subunit 1